MQLGEWKVDIIEEPWTLTGHALYLSRMTVAGREFLAKNGEVRVVKEGLADKDDLSFARLDADQLQALADGLAQKGLKTSNDHKNEGLLEATKSHLEDMRNLVFKKTK